LATNAVVDWNRIALTTALTTPGTQVYLTYVNLAMYNAVNKSGLVLWGKGPIPRLNVDSAHRSLVFKSALF